MQKPILLFDFDGVIVNTFDMCFTINKKFTDSLEEEDYKKRFEGNIYEAIKEAEKKENKVESKNSGNKFWDYYCPELPELEPVEGIGQVLAELHKEYILVIISSTISDPIRGYLEKYNFNYFELILGADVHKSKVEKIKMVFEKYGARPSDCLFITDTLGDILEAAKVGVETLCVSWGYHSIETLQRGGPVAILNKPADIATAVKEYFAKK